MRTTVVMADANKRINLTAPLLSVRRHGGGGAETTATGLPAYNSKADATTSEPPGHTSAVVSFGWEHRPGHPKSVRTRRPPTPPAPPLTIVDVDEPSRVTRDPTAVVTVASKRAQGSLGEARCSDALSRDDVVSCVTVNCSATGLSDAAAGAGAGSGCGSGPCARRSVMMDRFLPAAHAVAAGSPKSTFRKARSARAAVELGGARTAGGDTVPAQRRMPLLSTYHLPPLPPSGKNDDDDDDANSDAHSTAGFASRRCGLLSTPCVMSAFLLSRGSRRGAGTPFQSDGGGRSRREKNPLLPPPRSRNGRLKHTGDDHGMISQQSWEEVYIKSLLRSSPGGLMGPAAAVASELDRTVRELYKRRDGQAVRPKASHLGLLLVLDRSNEACGHVSPARKLSSRRTGDGTALLLKAAATKSSPDGDKQQLGRGRDAAADDAGGGGGRYGFPLLLEDKEAVAGRDLALLPLPLPKSPTESWLSRAVSTRPTATSFLGLHVQPKKRAPPLPWIDSSRGVHRDRQRQIRVHDLQK